MIDAETAVRRLRRDGYVDVPRRHVGGAAESLLAKVLDAARSLNMTVAYRIDHHHLLIIDCEH